MSSEKEVPQLFESQDYLNRKKEIMMEYEKKGKSFFKDLDKKVREEGFALVDIQVGQIKRPEVMPLVDGNPTHIDQLEGMVEKGRFPKEEFEVLKEKQTKLREEIDQIFLELRDLQKEVQENIEKMDRLMFMKMATDLSAPLKEKYPGKEDRKIPERDARGYDREPADLRNSASAADSRHALPHARRRCLSALSGQPPRG